MWSEKKKASVIVEEKGLKQITSTDEIKKSLQAVLDENQDKVAEYKNGKEKLFGFFIGQAMKKTGGKANPKMLNEILRELLGN